MHPLCTHIFPQTNKYNAPMNVNLPSLCVATLIPVMYPVDVSSIDSLFRSLIRVSSSSNGGYDLAHNHQ